MRVRLAKRIAALGRDEEGLSRCIFSTPELDFCAYLASRMVKEPKTVEGLFISAR